MTCNKNVNSRGKIMYSKGGPKQADGGKDLGKNATNVISKLGHNPKEVSPSSTKASANK